MTKLFGTDGIRGVPNTYPITVDTMVRIGRALVVASGDLSAPKIVIGKDTRSSCSMIESALIAGILSLGGRVHSVGELPTPGVAFFTRMLNAKFSIMVTASHNPAKDNGIKIFNSQGLKLSESEEKIIENILNSSLIEEKSLDSARCTLENVYTVPNVYKTYLKFAKSTIQNFSLSDFKITLDCANGASYVVAKEIFSSLGGQVITLYDSPNGTNINLDCGAMHPQYAAQVVKEYSADIGIVLDGDADRLIVIDETGEVIDGDYLLAFCALSMANYGQLRQNTIVVTEYSNTGLDIAMNAANINVLRTQNGDKFVMEEMIKGDYSFGGEFSGHIIFQDYSTTGDGIVAALQILKMLKISRLKASDLKKLIKKKTSSYPQHTYKRKKTFL